jgi:hypothetical protein
VPVASAVPTGRNLRSLQRQRRRHSIERRSLRTARTKWRPAQPPQFNASRYLFDLRTVSLFALARSHWFTGNLDRAVRYAAMAVEEADRSDHPIALCRALIHNIPLHFWLEDSEQVERALLRLEITAEKHSFEPYRAVALGFKGRYLIRLSRTEEGMLLLRDSLENTKDLRYQMYVTDFASELAVCM